MSALRIPVHVIKTLTVPIVMVPIPVLVNRDLLEMAQHVKVSEAVLTVIPPRLLTQYSSKFTTDFKVKPCPISFSSDIDECSAESSPCDVNADCTNSDGSYFCTCKQGFTGDGSVCRGINAMLRQ